MDVDSSTIDFSGEHADVEKVHTEEIPQGSSSFDMHAENH
jgi:hypothetical protein